MAFFWDKVYIARTRLDTTSWLVLWIRISLHTIIGILCTKSNYYKLHTYATWLFALLSHSTYFVIAKHCFCFPGTGIHLQACNIHSRFPFYYLLTQTLSVSATKIKSTTYNSYQGKPSCRYIFSLNCYKLKPQIYFITMMPHVFL